MSKLIELCLLLLGLMCVSQTVVAQTQAKPHLLVSKEILNEYIVEGKDLTLKYSIFNVGTSPAQSVTLEDSTFPPEEFTSVQGLLTVKWDRINHNSNVSHVIIMKPKVAGFFNVSWAKVTYSSSDGEEQLVGFSSTPGVIRVVSYPDFSRKHEAHLMDWLAFVAMSAPTILLPLFLWYRSYSKYENLKTKKA